MLSCKNLTPTLGGCIDNARPLSSSNTSSFAAFNGLWRSASSSRTQELRLSCSIAAGAAVTRTRDLSVRAATGNGAAPQQFDYDVVIIGAGVGGHGAALHAVEKVRYSTIDLMLFGGRILMSNGDAGVEDSDHRGRRGGRDVCESWLCAFQSALGSERAHAGASR